MVKLMFLLGIMFMMTLQPIFMISLLIFITFLYSYMIYNYSGTFWFGYVLLMVMLSGVLVIFTYMITMIPNEGFEMYNLMIFFILMILFMIECLDLYIMDFSMITVNLWNSYIGMMVLFLVGFLLSMMLLVVSLSYINDGAFRVKWWGAWMKG